MKINFCLWGTIRTGGNRVIFEVANGLVKKGHAVTITSLGEPQHWFPFKAKEIYPESKYFVSVPFKGKHSLATLANYFLELSKIPYEVDQIKLLAKYTPSDVDINVATLCFTSFAVWRSNKGVPFYYIQHYEPLFFSDYYLRKKAEESYYLPLDWITNSSWVTNILQQKYEKKGSLVVPGVNTKVFRPKTKNGDCDPKKIICLGKSKPIKGLYYALEALRYVHKKEPNIKLIMYGSEPSLKRLSTVSCDYVCNPSDEKLAELYSSSHVAIMPSLYESSPLVPLEAMACGTPVVVTQFGVSDYCYNNKNSIVIPPRDPKKMAESICRILTDESLAENLRKNGIKTAHQFTWERTVENVEKIFRKGLSDIEKK